MATTSPPSIITEQASNSSLWDRVSAWVSDNKAVAYTIAGTVVVVTGAGVVYYLSDSRQSSTSSSTTEKKKSKKERRKEKKQAEEAAEKEKAGIKLHDEEAG